MDTLIPKKNILVSFQFSSLDHLGMYSSEKNAYVLDAQEVWKWSKIGVAEMLRESKKEKGMRAIALAAVLEILNYFQPTDINVESSAVANFTEMVIDAKDIETTADSNITSVNISACSEVELANAS